MFDKFKEAKKQKDLDRQKNEILKYMIDEKALRLIGMKNLLNNNAPNFEKMSYEEAKFCLAELAKLYELSADVRCRITEDVELLEKYNNEKVESDFVKNVLDTCKKDGYKKYFTNELLIKYTKEIAEAKCSNRIDTSCLLGKKELGQLSKRQIETMDSMFHRAETMFAMMFTYLGVCDSEYRMIVSKYI